MATNITYFVDEDTFKLKPLLTSNFERLVAELNVSQRLRPISSMTGPDKSQRLRRTLTSTTLPSL